MKEQGTVTGVAERGVSLDMVAWGLSLAAGCSGCPWTSSTCTIQGPVTNHSHRSRDSVPRETSVPVTSLPWIPSKLLQAALSPGNLPQEPTLTPLKFR